MLDVRASRRAFAAESCENASDRRRRRRSAQLASSRAADVPRCASTPIRGRAADTPGFRMMRKTIGPARFVLSDGVKFGSGSEAEHRESDDQWLAASVAHVRELARKTAANTIRPLDRGLSGSDREIGSRQGRRRRRRAELSVAKEPLPIDRLRAVDLDEDTKQRRRRWTQELQDQVREQRQLLSKLKVDRSLRQNRLSCLEEKLAVAGLAEAKTADLVPVADKKLIVVQARFDETVRETKEMSKYANTLALMHGRAKDALQGAKVRAERLQVAVDTLSDEVVHTKGVLLTLEAARASAAKQKAKTCKQLADSSATNNEKTLALQDRVAVIDPDAVDEVELQVQAVRESKRKQRQARKEAKANEAKIKEDKVAVTLALTAAKRTEVEGAIARIHAATGIDEPDVLLEKFLTHRNTTSEAKRKVSAAELRLESLRQELQVVLEEESKAFLAYNPDTERLASRTKALRPRTGALKLAEANLSRCRGRAKTWRANLLVSTCQIFALLQKACSAVDCVQPPQHEGFGEGKGVVHLEALETLLLQLLPESHKPVSPPEDSENEVGRCDDNDGFSELLRYGQHDDTSDYGRLDMSVAPANCQTTSLSVSDGSFLPCIFHV